MARPRIGHTRKITIPDDVYADLELIASIQGVPVANVMRDAFRRHIRQTLKKRRRGAA
jgi:hypothetical protein